MATVIGIFEDHFLKNKPLPVVLPGTQSRRFTHIDDTINACYLAWKKNKCKFYSVSNRESLSILELAKLFRSKIKYLPFRKGERYISSLTKEVFSNQIYRIYGKKSIKDYVLNFIKKHGKI